jgi:aryl-alcohol dehydrogenase-like predicted oxidoreductase
MIGRRHFGKTGDELSVLGFGGVIVMGATAEDSANHVAEAIDRGITYFDVAPFYGNAQEMLGPALAPYRDRSFLACKTRERTAEGAQRELEESLQLLQTDHFDLYQLHSLQNVEDDVNVALGPGGAMETIVRARDAGKIRHIGFSAHTQEAAHAAMDQFDFDSVLFPVNYFAWTKGNFGPSVVERARSKNMAVLALKSLAHRAWTKPEWKADGRPWPKCWYKPLEDQDAMTLALRFTLSRDVDAAIPPGHWEFFERCLDIVEGFPDTSDLEDNWTPLETMAADSEPLFAAAT